MKIDASSTIAVTVGFVLLATVTLALLWHRIRWRGRSVLITGVVLGVTAAAALQVNRLTETYPSWGDLVGAASVTTSSSAGVSGQGRIIWYVVNGPSSGISMPMGVYLPAAYASRPDLRFPVIEALHGYPGAPNTWTERLDIAGHLNREITAGRMSPTVVLLPYLTPQRLVDTECTNLTGGPQAETYLTHDVPEWALKNLRVRTEPSAWGLAGFSAGGFCAMNLALRHPDRYAAAASLSGYADPGIKVGDRSERTSNNVAWQLAHRPQPPIALWVGWADDDHAARDGSRRIARLGREPLSVTTAIVPHGGHSLAVWRQMESPAFDWLSAHLARPLPG
ncbi:alpha/beta hydrolase [Actinoplanes sp. NPDC020271]|uniref:alpha/beta hydrolase n=1 Tax=Actinoplanes sp. NPDC020271 TaxID=3363896 RepID=UPI0037AC4C7F